MTVEPKVEDLLASIRKAIDSDMDEAADKPSSKHSSIASTLGGSSMSAQSRGMLLRGAMRELRVSSDGDRTPALSTSAEEIASLRNRVNMNRSSDEQTNRRSFLPAVTKTARSGFAGVLGGEQGGEAAPAEPSLPMAQAYGAAEAPPAYDPAYPPPPVPPWPGAGGYDGAAHYHNGYAAGAEAGYDPAYGAGYPPYAPPQPDPYQQQLMSPEAAYAANSAFGQLADSLMNRAMGGRSIEDTTRELLRSMLKQWLDDHLPQLVERLVREEIERVARRDR